jgi:hypothetical protein
VEERRLLRVRLRSVEEVVRAAESNPKARALAPEGRERRSAQRSVEGWALAVLVFFVAPRPLERRTAVTERGAAQEVRSLLAVLKTPV